MESVQSANIVLEELARLLNVWFEHDLAVTNEIALIHWAQQTAARAPRLPQPVVALRLLIRLNLAQVDGKGTVRPDRELFAQARPGAPALDRYSSPLARRVFERLLRLPEFAIPIYKALSYIGLNQHKLVVPWREVPRQEQGNAAWLWLQQLGLAEHTDTTMVFDPLLLPYVADTPPAKRTVSQAELHERLAAQRARAALAEEHVLELERQRLKAGGADDYVDAVVRVSVEDACAGFDIRSFEVTGAVRFIEVKSSAGPRQFFFLTLNEYDTACDKQASYWIAWVGWAANLPEGPCEVAWFQNPGALLEIDNSPWEVTSSDLCVRRVAEDSGFQFMGWSPAKANPSAPSVRRKRSSEPSNSPKKSSSPSDTSASFLRSNAF